MLGAGGAARAAVFGCRDKGAEVFILNRTLETAQKLAKQSGAKTIKREAVAKSTFDVIINATPVGMAAGKTAPASPLEAGELNARYVFDLVYNPVETSLLRLARQKGINVITGVEMFVQQGARQFEIWTGKPAPEEEMLRVILHSLRQSMEAGTEPTAPRPTDQPALENKPESKPEAVADARPAAKADSAPRKAPTKVAVNVAVAVKTETKSASKAPAKPSAPARKATPVKVSVNKTPVKAAAKKASAKTKSR